MKCRNPNEQTRSYRGDRSLFRVIVFHPGRLRLRLIDLSGGCCSLYIFSRDKGSRLSTDYSVVIKRVTKQNLFHITASGTLIGTWAVALNY